MGRGEALLRQTRLRTTTAALRSAPEAHELLQGVAVHRDEPGPTAGGHADLTDTSSGRKIWVHSRRYVPSASNS